MRLITFILTLALAVAAPAQMLQTITNNVSHASGAKTISFRTGQIVFANDSASGTVTTANLTSTTAGDFFWCSVAWNSSVSTVTMSATTIGALTAIGSKKVGAGTLTGFSGEMFYGVSGPGGTVTFTMTTSTTSTFRTFNCVEFNPSSGTVTLDGTATYSNTAAAAGVATVSGTSVASTSLVVAACMAVDSGCTAGTGYTSRDNGWNAANGALSEQKNSVSAGSQTATFGTGTTDNVILGLVGFQSN